MSALRDQFVRDFGEHDAEILEDIAVIHDKDDVESPNFYMVLTRLMAGLIKEGSDPFAWALVMSIDHECWSRPAFHEHHGFQTSAEDLRAWIHQHHVIGDYDGVIPDHRMYASFWGEWLPERREGEPK